MSATLTTAQRRPRKVWWLIGVVLLMGFVLLQMPATWLLAKIAPNMPYLQHVTGNLWQGTGIVQLPNKTSPTKPITGSLQWQWRPVALLTGKLGVNLEFVSNQTRLEGQVSRGFGAWHVQDLSGKIDKSTLAQVVDWQLPDAPIQVNAVTLTVVPKHQDDPAKFVDVDGQMTWAGGQLGYPSGAKTFEIMLPPMRADLQSQDKNDMQVLHANLVDNNSKRLGDFYVDGTGMVDVGLTQRLLENMPSYTGSAPADTAVVSVRQPLLSGLSGLGGGS